MYSFSPPGGSSTLEFHANNKGIFECDILASGQACANVRILGNEHFYTIHGVLMWAAWSLFALIQIYTNRYLVHKWQWRQIVHSVVGTLILLTSITSFGFVFKALDFKVHLQYHAIYGLVTLSAGILLAIGGIIA